MTVGHDGGRDDEYNAPLVSPPVSLTLDSPLIRGGQENVFPVAVPKISALPYGERLKF